MISYPSQRTRRRYQPKFVDIVNIYFVLALAEKSSQIVVEFVGVDAYFLSYSRYHSTFLSGLRGLRGVLP